MNNVKRCICEWWKFVADSYYFLITFVVCIGSAWYFSRPYDGWPMTFLLCIFLVFVIVHKLLYDTGNENRKIREAAKAQNIDLKLIETVKADEDDNSRWESIETEKLNDYKHEVLRLREIIERNEIDGEYHKAYIKKSGCKIKPVKRSYTSLIIAFLAGMIFLTVEFFSEDEKPDPNAPQPLSSPYYKDNK